jgi:hypothetical protein
MVLDGDYRTVLAVEEWLEAHRHLWSPNTVRGYATALAQWWTFLEQRGEADRWHEVGVPAVSGFLSWLRNGRTVEHAIAAVEQAPSAQTLEARLAALISFYRWQEAVFDVPVARRLLRGVARRPPRSPGSRNNSAKRPKPCATLSHRPTAKTSTSDGNSPDAVRRRRPQPTGADYVASIA